jgi:diaminohydroxyphosphoribosylaminopyrimidine deaminase / 5-amino-6-(5-phosphoribosylamino)uracil reductase
MHFPTPTDVMRHAIALAARGIGRVEPNPPVGAVLVTVTAEGFDLVAEGWHARFGGPHAEVHAIAAAGDAARGATLFVTLEPCCHEGKTPPCTRAILAAGIAQVVVGTGDPAKHVDGGGIRELRDAGLDVTVGVEEPAARALIAPFIQLQTTGRPWVHAKWAMTLDGKLAARTGHSRWISGEASRIRVHELRGRMDAIIVGAGTARADDPSLTARPPGRRTALRVVVDGRATLPLESILATTARETPVLLAVTAAAPRQNVVALEAAGVEVVVLPSDADAPGNVDVESLLVELGRRQLTHVLVEGGGRLLGSLFDAGRLDEVHVFVAPKIVGGVSAPTPIAGTGLAAIPELGSLVDPKLEQLGEDAYFTGRLRGIELD